VRRGNTGGPDHLSFDRAGVPGFNFIQDPIEYGTRTHHTDADTFERLVLDDLKQAATVVAFTVYHLATRDEMMPRKPPPPEPMHVKFDCRGELFAHLYVDGLRTFTTAVRLGFEGYPRTLIERRKPRLLQRRDMQKHILAAIVRRDEAEPS